MTYRFVLLLAAGLVPAVYGADFQEPKELHCSVAAIEPEHANFFALGARPPVLGDTIQLDMTAPEITDLTFDSGNAITIKQVNAKLVKIPTTEFGGYLSYYEGTHQSPTSLYTGILVGDHDEKTSQVRIEILRKQPFQGLTLHKMRLDCSHR